MVPLLYMYTILFALVLVVPVAPPVLTLARSIVVLLDGFALIAHGLRNGLSDWVELQKLLPLLGGTARYILLGSLLSSEMILAAPSSAESLARLVS